MIELLLGTLYFPSCAIAAGAAAWALNRGKEADDGRLFRSFMVPFVIAAVVLLGVSRTDTARKKIDPVFKLQAELDAHPIYAALKGASPDDHAAMHKALMVDGSKGMSVPAMFVLARPWLAQIGTRRMGFADAETRVAWAQISVDTLIELRRRSPEVCFQAIANLPEGNLALTQGLSASNSKTFEQTFVDLLKASNRAMAGNGARPEQAVEFNEAARQWQAIMESVKSEYGDTVTEIVAHRNFSATPPQLQGQVCSARVRQLGLMLGQPAPMASRLVDSAMR